MAKFCVFAPVLMVDHQFRLTNQRVAAADDAIKHIEIAAARQWRASVQGVIKAAQSKQGCPAKNHVASRAEHAGSARIRWESGQNAPKPSAPETPAKTAHLFEENLG